MSNEYVIKTMEDDNITEAETCQKEANQLRLLNHRNIVKFIGDFIHIEYSLLRSKYFYVITMEYCQNGDLVNLIEEHGKSHKLIKETLIMYILEQLCEAIAYIHRQNVVHRDIKLANILVCNDNSIRLGDFGLSDKINKIKTRKVGTRAYMPPEEFRGHDS
jgi:serine/threonine-protein kinase Chk2